MPAGLSAGSAELAAPVLSQWLFGTDNPDDLTAEQQAALSNITGLIGTGAGAATGNITDIIASTNAATNAVDNNYLTVHELTDFAAEMGRCKTEQCLQATVEKYQEVSDENFEDAKQFCSQNPGVKT